MSLTSLSLQISSTKFSKLVGMEASADTMESDVNTAIAFVVGSKDALISTNGSQENRESACGP